MLRGPLVRMAPTVRTKNLWNYEGSVNAIERSMRIGSAVWGSNIPDSFLAWGFSETNYSTRPRKGVFFCAEASFLSR